MLLVIVIIIEHSTAVLICFRASFLYDGCCLYITKHEAAQHLPFPWVFQVGSRMTSAQVALETQ